MEEHGGRMRLEDAKEGGARIHLSFPLYEKLNDEDVVRSGIA